MATVIQNPGIFVIFLQSLVEGDREIGLPKGMKIYAKRQKSASNVMPRVIFEKNRHMSRVNWGS